MSPYFSTMLDNSLNMREKLKSVSCLFNKKKKIKKYLLLAHFNYNSGMTPLVC